VLASCLADAKVAESAHSPPDSAIADSFHARDYLTIAANVNAISPVRRVKRRAILFATGCLPGLGALSSLPPAAQQTSS
jgi:hypothetical protein